MCDFWQKFNLSLTDHQILLPEITVKYGSIIKEIILGFLKLVKFEDAVFLELNQTKTKHLKEIHSYRETNTYRKTIKLFFSDTSHFFGFNFFYFEILLPVFTNTVTEIKNDMNNISIWSALEAEIYCFETICRNINTQNDLSFLDTLFDTMFEIPDNLTQIKKKVSDVIDEIGNVLSKRPSILMKAFNYLLVSLENPLLTSK